MRGLGKSSCKPFFIFLCGVYVSVCKGGKGRVGVCVCFGGLVTKRDEALAHQKKIFAIVLSASPIYFFWV